MTVTTISLEDLAKEIEGFSKAHIEKQKHAVVRGVARTLPDLVRASPVDTGMYANSWDMTVEKSGVEVGNYAPHAPIIEYGARPFTPPIGPLLAWAKRVLQDPSQPPEYSPEVWRLAVGVQKKIKSQGMEPKYIMTNMLPRMLEHIGSELKAL